MAYSLSGPDAPSVMGEQEARQRDTAMTMAIQALAMDRLRASVRTLSRETGFESRPMEKFSYAPLFIPKFRKWSNELQKIVGTDAPTAPSFAGGSANKWAFASRIAMAAIQGSPVPTGQYSMARGVYTPETTTYTLESAYAQLSRTAAKYGREYAPWANYLRDYMDWQEAQRNLPA